MKDTAYMICSRKKIENMRKTLPKDLSPAQIPIKVNLEIPDEQFGPKVLEKKVFVNEFRDNLDLEDVDFEGSHITEEEAEMIKENRKESARKFLEDQGFKVQEEEVES